MGRQPPTDIDPAARALIRRKVAALIGRYGFTAADRPDLEQELALHVHVRQGRHDPARASAATFCDRIVTRKIADLVRRATAAKRDVRRTRPLEAAEPTVLLDCPDALGRLDLAADVRAAVAALPPELRPVAELFMDYSEAEVMVRLNRSRQQVRTLRDKIARHLAARGL